MASKPSSPGPNSTTATPTKQPRSRKAATPSQAEQGRAGSAGGVVLSKEQTAKASTPTPKKVAATPAADDSQEANRQRRKPRKLNKDPTPAPATEPPSSTTKATANSKGPAEVPSASDLEALKSRVRGLEAKVEELYKAGAISDSRPARSPRRRGKGRKGSSSAQVPTLSTTGNNNARVQEVDDDEEEADEELVRLEGELEVARQDLESYHPRTRRTTSADTEDVEEIDRSIPGTDRQVTLSGSYRIPIPANVSVEDVKTIKSGVSAAQNVARSFLEQRRNAAALRAQEAPSPKPASTAKSAKATPPKPKRSMSSSMEVAVDNSEGKQSWGDWIGGYSMAITRAVSKIEHEAAMESQRTPTGGGGKTSAPGTKKAGGKRPPARATLSGEQVHGLMS